MRYLFVLILLAYAHSSVAYLAINRDGEYAVVLKNKARIIYQPCGLLAVQAEFVRKTPDQILTACLPHGAPYSVPELEYIKSVAAIYGVPTSVFDQLHATDVLTSLAFSAEGEFRGGPAEQRIAAGEEMPFAKLGRAYHDILQFLGDSQHGAADETATEKSSIAKAAILSFQPIFSDGKIALNLSAPVAMNKLDDACHSYWAVASLTNLLQLSARTDTLSALLEWTRAHTKVTDRRLPIAIGTFHYSVTPMRVASTRYPGTVISGVSRKETNIQFSFSAQTVEWMKRNKESLTDLDGVSTPLSSVPGVGSAYTVLPEVRSGQVATSLPVFCMRRVQSVGPPPQRPSWTQKSRLTELATMARVTPAKFYRLALNDPEMEKMLSPLAHWGVLPGDGPAHQELARKTAELFALAQMDFDQEWRNDQDGAAADLRARQKADQDYRNAIARQQAEQQRQAQIRRARTVPYSVKNNMAYAADVRGSYVDVDGGHRTFSYRIRAGETGYIGEAQLGSYGWISAESTDYLTGTIPETKVQMDTNAGVTFGLGRSGRSRR